jgi:integrase
MPWVKGRAGQWPGGRIWEKSDGSYEYVIRRQRAGIRDSHWTGAHTLRAAMKQLERFEAEPATYTPEGDPTREPLTITPELSKAFLDWSRDEKGNSRGWLLQQKAYLAWWAEQLAGRDLRKLDLGRDVIPALDGAPETRHRKEVLKAFCSWLRKERHLLSRSEDATLDLAVRARRPEQWTRPKAIPRAAYLRVLAVLPPQHRDSLILLDETGWHVSELARFVRGGTVQPAPPGRTEAGILETRHKSGEPHRTAVGPEAKAAAERLRERGGFSTSKFYEALQAAGEKLRKDDPKFEMFTPGRFRHTFATRAIDEGVAPEAVSAYLGHKSPATMRRFYATLASAPRPKRKAPESQRPPKKKASGRRGGGARGPAQ